MISDPSTATAHEAVGTVVGLAVTLFLVGLSSPEADLGARLADWRTGGLWLADFSGLADFWRTSADIGALADSGGLLADSSGLWRTSGGLLADWRADSVGLGEVQVSWPSCYHSTQGSQQSGISQSSSLATPREDYIGQSASPSVSCQFPYLPWRTGLVVADFGGLVDFLGHVAIYDQTLAPLAPLDRLDPCNRLH
eukprot:gene13574-biopygen12982